MQKHIQIVGPSFTNYSLARVNRGLALALQQNQSDYKISVVSNAQYAEREPSDSDLAAFPELKELFRSEIDPEGIVIYNNFPRDPNGEYGIAAIKAAIKVVYIAWEESVFPTRWVKEFNDHADAVFTSSSFVRDILVKSGLRIPAIVALNAIDQRVIRAAGNPNYPLETKKQFKFLHISSGYPRKGTDILISAFAAEFSDRDDVCLVIKGLPHPLNKTPLWVAEVNSKPNHPEIELINTEISDEQLSALLSSVEASVYPARSEGFGIPIAESMLMNVPVITTGYGSQLDFIDSETGFLIDYKLVPASESQLVNLGAYWAEPDVAHLRKLMRTVYENRNTGKYTELLAKAQKSAVSLTWENTAAVFQETLPKITKLHSLKKLKKLVITERNSQSGIADYTAYLHKPIEQAFTETVYLSNSDVADLVEADDDNVHRTWTSGEIEFKATLEFITDYKPDIIHIEYHSANYKPEALNHLLSELNKFGVNVFLTLHSASVKTADVRSYVATLNSITQIFVHSETELERLRAAGIKNVTLMIHGNALAPVVNVDQLKETLGLDKFYPIIATHGLLTNQKGIDQLIKSLATIKNDYSDAFLLLVNAVSSNNISSQSFFEQYQDLVKGLKLEDRVMFVNDFLTPSQILALLQVSDLNILAYNDNGEGGSGAIQKLIAVNRPMLVTDVPAFAESKNLAKVIGNNEPATIYAAILELLADDDEQERQNAARKDYLNKHNWFAKRIELLLHYAAFLKSE